VPVEREDARDAEATHGFETRAVHEREAAPGRRQQGCDPGIVRLLIDPENSDLRHDSLLQRGHGTKAEPALNQGERLQRSVVRRHELCFRDEKMPGSIGARVRLFIRVQHGEQGGR
jgi:hypothetical protein